MLRSRMLLNTFTLGMFKTRKQQKKKKTKTNIIIRLVAPWSITGRVRGKRGRTSVQGKCYVRLYIIYSSVFKAEKCGSRYEENVFATEKRQQRAVAAVVQLARAFPSPPPTRGNRLSLNPPPGPRPSSSSHTLTSTRVCTYTHTVINIIHTHIGY